MLRHVESLCLALITGNVAAWGLAWQEAVPPDSLKLPLIGGFALFFLLLLVALGRATPLARARRPRASALDEPEGLGQADMRALLTLAPRWQKALACGGGVALVIAAAVYGSVSWSTGEPFERRHALGIALYVTALASLLCPYLGALSRLPDALEDQLRFLQRHDARRTR